MSGNRSNFKAKPNSKTNKPPRKLHLETLEDRLAPASLPIDLINHLSNLISSLGITQITAQPPAPREVIGSVHLKLAPSGLVWDPVEGSLPSEPVTAPIDDPLEENPASPEDPTATQPPKAPFEQPNQKPGIDPIQGIGIINPVLPGLPNLGNDPAGNPGQGNNPANGLNPGAGNQLPGGGANQPGAGGNLPGGGANQPGAGGNLPGGGGILPGGGGGANLPGGSYNPGFNIPGGGYLPTNGNNPINPATGSPFWPNPGPMPGSGINPGAGNAPASDPNPGTTAPGTGTAPSGSTGGSGTPSKNLQVSGIAPDTGSSNSDRITKAQSPSVVGTAPANSQITILLGSSVIGRGTADASGKFKAPISVALEDGVYTLQVACNQASSASLQVTIDTKAPAPTITATRWVPEKVNLEVTLGWEKGSDTTGTIAVDVDLNQNGSYEENELAYRTGTADSVFVLSDLNGYGEYGLRARAEDVAGNVGTATAQSFVDHNAGWVGSSVLRGLAQPAYAAMGFGENWDGRAISNLDSKWTPLNNKLLEPITITARAGLADGFGQFLAEIKKLGLTQITTNNDECIVEGFLPTYQILALPSLPYFSSATKIQAVSDAGSVQNEGVPVMNVPQFMAQTGYTGLGMKVGVISDSANSTGAMTAAQASGDLPQNIVIINDLPANQGSDEGCAMMEVAYDVAPAISFVFGSGFLGAQTYADNIQQMSSLGCQIIVDDINLLNSPVYNNGRVAQAINDVVNNQNRFFCGSAGNYRDNGWRGDWVGIQSSIGSGSNVVTGTFLSFGGTPYQTVNIPNGGAPTIAGQWDAAFLEDGSNLPNFQVPNQVNMYLIDLATNTIVNPANQGTDNNLNTDEAFQIIAYANSGSTSQFGLAFQLVQGPAPTKIAWAAARSGQFSMFPNGGGGIANNFVNKAQGCVTVAAADWSSPTVPESFSSMGGVQQLWFDDAGNRLSTPIEYDKQNITAPDGISTTLPLNGGLNPFYGTSCAAPQVAGIAALVWGNQPNLTNDQLTFHFYATALDMGTPGYDYLTGFGMIQAVPVQSDAFGSGDISNNSLTAWDLGVIGNSPVISQYLDISNQAGLPDFDWFTLRAGQSGKLNLRMLQGTTGSLEVKLYTLDQNLHLVERASSTKPNQFIRNLSLNVAANQLVYIEVKGRNSSYGVMDEAYYQMTLKIS